MLKSQLNISIQNARDQKCFEFWNTYGGIETKKGLTVNFLNHLYRLNHLIEN